LPVDPQAGSRKQNAASLPPVAAAWKSANRPVLPPAARLMSVKVDLVSGSAS